MISFKNVLVITNNIDAELDFIEDYFKGIKYECGVTFNPNGYVCDHYNTDDTKVWIATYPIQAIGHRYHEIYLDSQMNYPDDYEKHLKKVLCFNKDVEIKYINKES